jgi:hypothetical protein
MNIPEGFHLAGNGLIISNNEWFGLKLMSLSFAIVAIILFAWLRWEGKKEKQESIQ